MATVNHPHSGSAPARTSSSGRVLTILGFVFGALALIILPPVFGIAGIACSGVAISKGDRLAKWALAASIVGMVVGMALGAVVMSSS